MATLRRLLVLVILLGLTLVSGSPLAPQASAQVPPPALSDAPVRLPGHTVSVLSRATKVARTASAITADPSITLTVVLNRSDEAGFQRFLADIEDPHSANHGKFLSQDEITKRFGPSQQAYDETVAYLQQQGLTLVEGSANRLTLTVKGTRAQVEHAFSVQIGDYQLGNRSFYANDQDPLVPGSMAQHIQAVAGLSNLAQPQPQIQTMVGAGQCVQRPYGTVIHIICFTGGIFAGILYILGCLAYDSVPVQFFFNTPLCNPLSPNPSSARSPSSVSPTAAGPPGTGQKIGLLEFDTFNAADVSAYLNLTAAPASRINRLSKVAVNGGVASPGPGEAEVLLDIDTVMSIAPGANVVVYHAPSTTSFQSLFNTMINDGDTVISNSWSYCEDQTSLADVQSLDAIFANGAASGVSVFNASGDSGSTCLDGSPNTVGVPADAPHATAVGGTTAPIGPGFTYGGETWWEGSHASPPTGQGGFGVSRFFPRPAYQDSLTSSAMRSIPDVVANADPRTGMQICQADAGGCPDGSLSGGTSIAAPEWAGMAALLNQSRGNNLGNFNPLLYPHANTTAFHTPASMGSDFAHVGLGSPRIDQLDIALGGLTVGPGSGTSSSVAAVPTSEVAADGVSTATIRVALLDANSHFLSGKNATLTASAGSHATISAPSGPSTIDNGTVLFTVTDSTIEDVTFTATDTTDGVPIQQTATVHFISPPATTGGIAAFPPSVAANGTTTSTITVTLQNAQGQGLSGKVVTLSQGSGHSQVTGPTPSTTDVNGHTTFTVTNHTTETITYTATDVTDGNLPVPGSATVSFTSGSAQPPCSTGTPTAAPGYAFTDFATGLEPFSIADCIGPGGITFDAAGNLYVMNQTTGFLYKFGPQGGVGDATHRLNTVPIGGFPTGITFGNDGKLYLARPGSNDVLELNPSTGAIVRTVTSGLCFPLGLATDPLSGDLFVTQNCSVNMMRIANPASVTPVVTVYASPGVGDGLTVAPDGTFYVAANAVGSVVRVAGTNAPTPGATTIVANVSLLDGVALALNAGVPAFLFVNRNNGIVTKVDLTTNPITQSPVFTGGSRGDMAAVGPDGCFYGTQTDRVIKITNADGSCPFSPTINQPQLGLTPATVAATPTGTPQTYTATLHNVASPAGTTITFTVTGANPQTKQVQADANGIALFTYTGAHTGTDTVTATATVGATNLVASPASITWAAGKNATFTGLNLSPTSGAANVPTILIASLTDVSHTPPIPIGAASLSISIGSQTCTATTGNDGIGSCSITPNGPPGSYPLVASYAGNSQYTTSTATQSFRVGNLVAVTLAYTGATTLTNGSAVTLSATLTAQGGGALSGKTVTFTIGSGATAQSCSGTTDDTGAVRCTINMLNQPTGAGTISLAFAGDTIDAATTTPVSVTIIALPSSSGLQFYPLSAPVRLLDTRPGQTAVVHPGTPLTPKQALSLPGQFSSGGISVPAGAQALVGNATVDNTVGAPAGFATLYPSGASLPLASNLNFVPGTVRPNAFTVGLGSDGKFNLLSNTGGNFIIDIIGYYAPPATGGLFFHPLTQPVRLLDTRPGQNAFKTPGAALTPGQTLNLPGQFTANGITVPSGAKALAGNATVDNTIGAPAGFATLFPGGTTLPPTSNLNFVPGAVAPNAFTVGLGGDGSFNLFSNTGGNFILDITGYYDTNGAGGLVFYPLTQPVRELDTRAGQQAFKTPGAPLTAKGTINLPGSFTFSGVAVPSEAKALVGNATVDNTVGAPDGFATLYPGGTTLPLASNLNFSAGTVAPNAFIVGVGAEGTYTLYSNTGGNFIIDISGYFSAGTGTSSTTKT